MPGEICLEWNGEKICFPLYVAIRRVFPGDPDPEHIGGIDLGELVVQPASGAGVRTIRWMERIGLDAQAQQQLAAVVQIADAARALPQDVGTRVHAMMDEHLAGMALPRGASLHLDARAADAASARRT